MNDAAMVGIIAFGLPFIVVVFASWILHYFIALRSPPARRAAWTVGVAYLLATAFCEVATPAEYRWAAPLAAIPGALVAYWWWRDDFRRDWFDDAQGIPDGVELANDDWRVGLIFVGIIATVLVGRILFRLALEG